MTGKVKNSIRRICHYRIRIIKSSRQEYLLPGHSYVFPSGRLVAMHRPQTFSGADTASAAFLRHRMIHDVAVDLVSFDAANKMARHFALGAVGTYSPNAKLTRRRLLRSTSNSTSSWNSENSLTLRISVNKPTSDLMRSCSP